MPKAQVKSPFQFEQLKKRKEYLVALILLFVIVIVWIVVSLFASQEKLGISPADKKLAQPIKPTFNASILDVIQQKKLYSQAELANFPIFAQAEDEEGNQFLIDVRDLDSLFKGKTNPTSSQPPRSPSSEESSEATESGATQREDIDLSPNQ